MNPIPTLNNFKYERAFQGDISSTLALTRSLCWDSNAIVANDLETRLANPNEADNPISTKLCQALLHARSPETYKEAKEVFRAHLKEKGADSFSIQIMLIYIKIFSPKHEVSVNSQRITQKFLEAIDATKKTGCCFDEIQVKEEYLNYVLNLSTQAEEVEKGLQLQLDVMNDLFLMASGGFEVEDLINRQLSRYLDLILKYFGEEGEADVELAAKNTLEAAINNPHVNSTQKKLAEYHLAQLQQIDRLPNICDVKESSYHLKNLQKKWPKEPLYADGLIGNLSIEEERLLYKNGSNDQKAKNLYKLALTYLPSNPKHSKEFEIEKAWGYFQETLKYAHPSSFLIPLAHFHLMTLYIFKKQEGNQHLEGIKAYFNTLKTKKNLSAAFFNKINYFGEILLNWNGDVKESKASAEWRQLIYCGLLAMASDDPIDFYTFYPQYAHLIPQDDKISTTENPKDTAQKNLINSLQEKQRVNYNDLRNLIFNYVSTKKIELVNAINSAKLDFQMDCYEERQLQLKDTVRTYYSIDAATVANKIYKIYKSYPSAHNKATLCHYARSTIESKLKKLLDHFNISLSPSNSLSLEVQISILHKFALLLEKDGGQTENMLLKFIRSLIINHTVQFLNVDFEKKTEEELIFLINIFKICIHHYKFMDEFPGYMARLGNCYLSFSEFFKGNTKSNLLLESARLLKNYYTLFSIQKNNDFSIYDWETRLKHYDLAYVNLYLDAFHLSKNNLKKYDCIGNEILEFGTKLINEYIQDSKINKNLNEIPFPNYFMILYKTCVDLLRFHDREDEADELIHTVCEHPAFALWTQHIKKQPLVKKSQRRELAKDCPIEAEDFKVTFYEGPSRNFNFKKHPGLKQQLEAAQGLEWIPSFDLQFFVQKPKHETPIITSSKPKRTRKKNDEETKPSENNEPYLEKNSISATAEAKENAKIFIENQERKQRLKMNRVQRQPIISISHKPIQPIIEIKLRPNIYLSPSCIEIYNKLWVKNSGALNKTNLPPFDAHDYKNKIHLSKDEVKKLIDAFGGKFHEDQGKGSHEKGTLPACFNTPKITFEGKTMSFSDFDSQTPFSDNIILTKSNDLKKYQILQLRKLLIRHELTPDLVKSASENLEKK